MGELVQSFGLQRQSDLDSLPMDPPFMLWSGGEIVYISPLVFSARASGLPKLLGCPHEHCLASKAIEISHGRIDRAAPWVLQHLLCCATFPQASLEELMQRQMSCCLLYETVTLHDR